MVSHNNVIPNQHFKKKWQFYVKTWFNQPARKTRRQNARAEKARKVFPRPVAGALRPIVHGQTVKYNLKKRYGRGFTMEELKEAAIAPKTARTIGIAVDHRRKNRSLESLQENANRLKAYKSKLVVFPRRSKKPKQGDSSAEELQTVEQHKSRHLLPIVHEKPEPGMVDIPADLKEGDRAYYKLRLERTNAKLVGVRSKRAAEAAAEEAAKAK
ncbi:60S ribosomal protein L13 [Trebouxia sp. C0009 RCD-2024]